MTHSIHRVGVARHSSNLQPASSVEAVQCWITVSTLSSPQVVWEEDSKMTLPTLDLWMTAT